MKLLLLIVLTIPAYQNWSAGDIYVHRVDYLIDCQMRGELPRCVREVRAEGMSQRDLKLALEDVRNAVKK